MHRKDTLGLKREVRSKQIKICITCSPGGHWSQAGRDTSLLGCERYYVTYYTSRLEQESKARRIYFVVHNRRSPFLFLINAWQSLRILLKERPDVILSTGADVTVPTCILGKLLGVRLIYVESAGNVCTPSLTGRILYPMADLFFVQWSPLKKRFPRAILGGPLL